MKLSCCSGPIVPARAVIAVMVFTACLFAYMLRVNMSINIIAMIEPTQSDPKHPSPKVAAECAAEQNTTSTEENLAPDYGVRYNWDSRVQGLILGAYFWGYILTSIPGGYLAERFGPTRTVGLSALLSAAITILTPLCASWHYVAVLVSRFLLGFLGGVVYPALHCLISRWAPPSEKGKFVGALLGGTFGTVLTWPILGTIIENLSWTWAFYIPGVLTMIWCVFWFMLVSDTPDESTTITEEEKCYIKSAIGDSVEGKIKSVPPYLSIFTSIPFWALTVLHFGNLWGLYLLLTAGPKFMSEVLGFQLSKSGGLAGLPYLARLLSGFVFGSIGDALRSRNILSVSTIRKTFIFFSHFMPGLLLLALLLIGCNATLSVLLITLSLGFNGASTVTNLQNSQDLAPNYAGTLYGIVNCIGGTTGFITPILTGFITSERSGLSEWHLIFGIGASIYIGCGIIFCIFGTGVEQPWNNSAKPNRSNDVRASATVMGIENSAYDHRSDETDATKEKITQSENTKV